MGTCQKTKSFPGNGGLSILHHCVNQTWRRWGYLSALALCLLGGLLCTASAAAVANNTSPPVTNALLTADNHYALYVGNEDGSVLVYIGRNEAGPEGSTPGTHNWQEPETFSLDIAPGQYIYVVAWDGPVSVNPFDMSSPQMWIGQFTFPDSSRLHTGKVTQWDYCFGSGFNPMDFSDPPSLATLAGDIAGAAWARPVVLPNGTPPWATVSGFDSEAMFLWADGFDLEGDPTGTNDTYVIFRSQAQFVPIPTSVLLLGSGLVGLGLLGFRRKRS